MLTVIIAESYRCVGSCVTAFTEEGECIVPELPWRNEIDFALADQQAEHMDEEEFYRHVHPDPFIEDEIDGHEVEFLHADGVYMIYDTDTNRHYFFA